LNNIQLFVTERARLARGTPLLIPIFTKCRQNLGEMELWYDQWIRAIGSAVIVGPSDCAGQIPDVAVADMAPPMRQACRRLTSRMSVLSDGSIVACEQDVLGRMTLGKVGTDRVTDVWQQRMTAFRAEHRAGQWNLLPLCSQCREWDRP
jgi:radical SAM protein with 4Fe4S-binding SPASM domain